MALSMFTTILLIFIFSYGLVHGSFLNVLIYRLPRKISIVSPARSACPVCGNMIAWYDNIPLFSWLFLRGRCRHCNTPISVLYPVIELLSGIIAILSAYYFGINPTALLVYIFTSILLVITVIDLQFMIIPDVINKPGMVIGVLIGGINEFTGIFDTPITSGIADSLLGAALGYGLLYFIAWAYFKYSKVSGLGGGDIKLMGFTGALLGVNSIIPSILIASFAGVLIGSSVLLLKRSGLKTEIPFGPWLALGILCHMLGGDPSAFINSLLMTTP
jgi:leader peptidase (prepilin peptidase) / N-methyltransferase